MRWAIRIAILGLIVPSLLVRAKEPNTLALPSEPESGEAAPPDHKHWAFVPPVRPEIPQVVDKTWPRNPIDYFVLSKLEQNGLRPSREADKATLLRRLSFDLTGLPPTPEEIDSFVKDPSDSAYNKQVDRLLGSSRYGVRWAQHWLDLVRYADSDGFESDRIRPHSWRYRDWVVYALNGDMRYDNFVRQQLAGDEIEPEDPLAFIATGFLRCYSDSHDPDPDMRRYNTLTDITETTGLAFLGLTVGCARCHDHKYDPIAQSEFYKLQAFFAAAHFTDEKPIASPAQKADHAGRVAAWNGQVDKILAEVIGIEAAARRELAPGPPPGSGGEVVGAFQKTNSERTPYDIRLIFAAHQRDRRVTTQALLARLDPRSIAVRAGLLSRLAEVVSSAPSPLPLASGVDELGVTAPPTYRLRRGELNARAEEVRPAFPAVLCKDVAGSTPVILPTGLTTGRRRALADWLVQPSHPLTARVIVNRLWQQHFGRGIVASASDLGMAGEAPSHPDLLDWLATEFVARGWSLKEMHRLMVKSAAYRQASITNSKALEFDPENTLIWRHSRRRLDAEEIRDALLFVSGQINLTRGGPPFEPGGKRDSRGLSSKLVDDGRRSLYLVVKRSRHYPFFETFDRPDAHSSCPQRLTTTVATQALAMLNGQLTHRSARALAARVTREAGNGFNDQLGRAYRLSLGRSPEDEERRLGLQFLEEGPLDDLMLCLFNANEFMYID
jgi:Protein of unknown function (DUF1553)/Protein of unknown function (DUF1549)